MSAYKNDNIFFILSLSLSLPTENHQQQKHQQCSTIDTTLRTLLYVGWNKSKYLADCLVLMDAFFETFHLHRSLEMGMDVQDWQTFCNSTANRSTFLQTRKEGKIRRKSEVEEKTNCDKEGHILMTYSPYFLASNK